MFPWERNPLLKLPGISVLLACQGSLLQSSEKQGLKLFKPGAFHFCRLALLQVSQALQLFSDCSGIGCALHYWMCSLHWAPHLLKSTEKQQDPSDSFILGRTPRMDSMTFGMYFSSASPSVLRNKDDQGQELHSMFSIFKKCHRFYLQSSMLQNDLTFQWKKHFWEKNHQILFWSYGKPQRFGGKPPTS